MSTLQVANVHFESTGNNRIQYAGSNAVSLYTAGSERVKINSSTGAIFQVIENSSARYSSISIKNSNTALNSASQLILYSNNANESIELVSFAGAGGWLAFLNPTGGVINVNTNQPLSFRTNNTERMRIDADGNVLVTGPGGLGYGTGSGGTVTQLTSKTTGVTINKLTGQITTNNAALAASAVVAFTVTNSTVAATDTVIITVSGNANYSVRVNTVSAGSFGVLVQNISGGSLSEAIVLNFAVIKAVAA